jgi:hypothetical protein
MKTLKREVMILAAAFAAATIGVVTIAGGLLLSRLIGL